MGQRCEREEKEILMNWAYYIVLPEADTESDITLQSATLRSNLRKMNFKKDT